MFSQNKGDGINGKLFTVGNLDVSYAGNRTQFIGNQNVTYKGEQLYSVGSHRVYYIGGKIDRIGNEDVHYRNGKIDRIGSEDVRYEPEQHVHEATTHTSPMLPVNGYSLAFYPPYTKPKFIKPGPPVSNKPPGCGIL